MNGATLLQTFMPFRPKRSGILLAAAAAATVSTCSVAEAQVRTHGEGGGSYTISVMSWRDIPFRTTVRQQYDYSCGSAAVATLLRHHYGVSVEEAEVFRSMYERGDQERIQRVGFSMLDMRGYLERAGFQADGLRLSLDRLATLNIPAIALITHDNYRHFVVVKGVSDTEVLVGDPTFGLQTYSRADFEAVWNGVVLAIRHAPDTAAAPAFNRTSEWGPWSVAPLDEVRGEAASPSQLGLTMPELYQITGVTVIE
jgi:predicted double-glycine peptidase